MTREMVGQDGLVGDPAARGVIAAALARLADHATTSSVTGRVTSTMLEKCVGC